jgi:elongation factor P--(R)-beta-lysine ligase
LAAGERRIVEFAKVFRNRERTPLHHPEFTLVEWYRAGEPYGVLMDDCVAMLREAARAAGVRQFNYRGRSSDPFAESERLTVAEAFGRFAGIDLLATLKSDAADRERFAQAAQAAGIRIADDDRWADIFSRALVERIEPHLGIGRPTILDEYPAVLSALAKPAHDPRVAERFELYVCGVELANGFGEFTDAAEQGRRLEAEMAEKERVYGERYPIDDDFITALAHMPQASGVALGLDRLVMLATGASRIEQVLWTPLGDPTQ